MTEVTVFQDKGSYYHVSKLSSEQYQKQCRTTSDPIPIIIDNGSYQCRAGWSLDQEPRLVFRSLVGRPKTKKGGDFLLVGDQISETDYFNLKTKSPFDNNVVNNFELMEYLLDYVFAGLGLGKSSSIDHPVLLTEPICNPNYSRAHMSELLFECYRVPTILYGVDSLFSLYYNLQQDASSFSSAEHALIVSSSFENSHVYPVTQGRGDFAHCIRIPVGGQHGQQMVLQSLQTSYPLHKHQFTVFRAQELVENYSVMVPGDYGETIDCLEQCDLQKKEKEKREKEKKQTRPSSSSSPSPSPSSSSSSTPFSSSSSTPFLKPLVTPMKIQLPFIVQEPKPVETEADVKLKAEKKLQNQQRLRKLAAERREKKLEKRRENLENCESLKRQRDSGEIDQSEFESRLREGGFDDESDFLKVIKDLKKRIEKDEKAAQEREKLKLASGGGEVEEVDGEDGKEAKSDSELYPLLNVADDKLTPEQAKEKKKQRFLKNAAAGRARKKAEKDALKEIEKQEKEEEEKKRLADPIGWLAHIHSQRNKILDNRARRQKLRAEAASRRLLSKKRMHLLAKTFKDEEGSFGDDSSDWQVYRSLQETGVEDTDSEEDKKQLTKYEALLNQYDKDSLKKEEKSKPEMEASHYQIDYYAHRIQAPEVVYQPSLIGLSETGLAESLARVFSGVDKKLQESLAQNIFVCGGNTKYQNFCSRLLYELTAMRPFQSRIKVNLAKDPVLDSWRGARLFAQSCARAHNWGDWITQAEYQEKGAEYLKEHRFSNIYIPSPAPPPSSTPTLTSSLSLPLPILTLSPDLSPDTPLSSPPPAPTLASLPPITRASLLTKSAPVRRQETKTKKEPPSRPSLRPSPRLTPTPRPTQAPPPPPPPPQPPPDPTLVYTHSRSVADLDDEEEETDFSERTHKRGPKPKSGNKPKLSGGPGKRTTRLVSPDNRKKRKNK